ncbi:hypothetical protein HY488_00185 [Candidatus Woesearchaeota archaeon]|nr:hypothetical protein [Candidatus Woesearchaeota archaeon]
MNHITPHYPVITLGVVLTMRICVPRETYPLEKRVMVLPSAAKSLVDAGHDVFVQLGAASELDIADNEYVAAGAKIIADDQELYGLAEMIVKLKAPSPQEFSLMHDAILFSMFHSEQNPVHIYYAGLQNLVVVEMERIRDGKQKRLIDQTDVTGEVGVYYALRHSQKMPEDMKAVILGYGNVASGAIKACAKLGIQYKIIRRSEFKFISEYLKDADILINGLAWPESARAKKEYVVTRENIQNTTPGFIVLDLSVDFPNPIETVHPTTYANPFYLEEGRVHISIYGYPGLVPKTSGRIYSEQVLPLALTIANNGGLRGIREKGELGRAISRAILDPQKCDWKQYKPEAPTGSRIE